MPAARRPWISAPALAGALLAAACAEPAPRPTAVAQDSGPGPLLLSDDDFWGDPGRTRGDVVARISKSEFRGILIDAPKRVDVGRRDTLPVAGYFVRSLRDDRELDQERQMIVVAVEEGSGRTYAGLALATGKEPPPRAAPSGDPGEGTTLNLFTTDVRRAAGLPWGPGRFRVTMLLAGLASNTLTVELAGAGESAAPSQPAVRTRLAASAAGTDGPRVPSGPGILLARKGSQGCTVAGSFRLALGGKDSAAAGRISLLLTGASAPGPWVTDLDVPWTTDGEAWATGTFEVDLARSPGSPGIPQDGFVWAFAPGGIGGPVRCSADER